MRTVDGSKLYRSKSGKRVMPVVDGIKFASKAEAKRYGQIKQLERAKLAQLLKVQPRLDMIINGRKLGRGYLTLDFCIRELVDGKWAVVYEDVKGKADTPYAKLRREVAAALHPDKTIRVVSA